MLELHIYQTVHVSDVEAQEAFSNLIKENVGVPPAENVQLKRLTEPLELVVEVAAERYEHSKRSRISE